jgi:Carbohydrate family 9 binding domain-like
MKPNRVIALLLMLLLLPLASQSQNKGVIISVRAKADFALTADPNAPNWKSVAGVVTESGRRGENVPNHRTEIRSVWTPKNLYLLFICQYEELNLKANPSTTTETNKLWEWDVAEAFIGTDFNDIKHYTEYQVSPQGEWVDLDIDRKPSPAKHDVDWNSGYEVKARVDAANKVWYGAMRIPMNKIDKRKPKVGLEMRANFYRIQGTGANKKFINWQPVNNDNYHTPEAFGRLRLGK